MNRDHERMKFMSAALACAALGATTLTSAAAQADPPRTARAVQFGAGFRYGVSMDDPYLDPWGPGLGLELGYTTQDALYFGTVLDYFFGESRSVLGTKMGANLWQIAAEGGYDLQLSDGVLVRPKVGVGVATLTLDCDECIGAGTETKLAAAPGLTTMFFPGSLVLSIDARYQMVFADEMVSALVFAFGIGF